MRAAVPTATLPPRIPTDAERRADAAVHLLGLAATAAGTILLLTTIRPDPTRPVTLSAALYLLGLIATFTASAAYNMAPEGRAKPILRRLDHAAIFLMIAGTYTPVALLGLGGPWGTALCLAVWAGALPGIALKLLAPGRYERTAFAAYLVLGWIGVVALIPLVRALPVWQSTMICVGGLLYSAGTLFHVAQNSRYNVAIWHVFVLAAAACHYAVVLQLTAG